MYCRWDVAQDPGITRLKLRKRKRTKARVEGRFLAFLYTCDAAESLKKENYLFYTVYNIPC